MYNNNLNRFLRRCTAFVLALLVGISAAVAALPSTVLADTTETETPDTPAITATLEGLDVLYVGVNVTARIVFTLTNGRFVDEIYENDFFVWGLPSGLQFEEPVRFSNTVVHLPITGAPSHALTGNFTLRPPTFIPGRNILLGIWSIPVTAEQMEVSVGITESATISPGSTTFDINPEGWNHRDISVTLQARGHELMRINYGRYVLQTDVDYTPWTAYSFTIHSSFLERLPVGEWELVFTMRRGNNPTITVNVVDTTPGPPAPPVGPIGPAPAPPIALPHPDNTFIYLSGGQPVNTGGLNFLAGRPRVSPRVQDGTATITVRASVLESLAWNVPGAEIEVRTPLARVHLPADILDVMRGARVAALNHSSGLGELDFRLSIIDRSYSGYSERFATLHPRGEVLSTLADIRMQLVCADTGEVVFTAEELLRPIESVFVIMPIGQHLRPTAVHIPPGGWPEFAPNRSVTPNEILVRSAFAGVHGIVHNGAYFDDVPFEHWGFAHAYTAAYSGLVATAGTLNPSAAMTRGEFAQLIAFAMQLPRAGVEHSRFTDIAPNSVFFDGVTRAEMPGFLQVFVGDSFVPNAAITRQEMGAMVGSIASTRMPWQPASTSPIMLTFSDSADIHPLFAPGLQSALDFGILGGMPDNTFRPNNNVTRIEALAVTVNLIRALGYID